MNVRGLNRLFKFDGYCLEEAIFSVDLVQVRLGRDGRRRVRCPHCGARARPEITVTRTARDLAFGPAIHVLIFYPALRVFCGACARGGWITPREIDSRRQVTQRLLHWAARLARDLPLSQAADLLSICDTRLRRWDRAVLTAHLPAADLDNLCTLMVDEKAIGRGHAYVTIVLNGQTGELLHLHAGRKKESLKAFFDTLTDAQKAGIQAVCVDRLGAYVACIEEELPDAEIVFDKFHLVRNFNDVVDAIRRDEWNKVRKAKDTVGAKFIKGQRYNLLRRPENNSARQQARLDELLAINEPLSKAYVLLEDFRDTLSPRYIGYAAYALKTWIATAMDSGLDAVRRFAARLKDRLREVVNAIRFRLNNGRLEGFNNLIARIIHRGCGYRDESYLFLKLRQASLPRELQVPVSQK